MQEEIVDLIKKIDNKVEVTFEEDNTFYLIREDWNSEAFFEINEEKGIEYTLDELKCFLNYKYLPNLGIINENYVELSVNLSNRSFLETFEGAFLTDGNKSINNIYYEIGGITDDFDKIIKLYNDFPYADPEDYMTTIKIYNIDLSMDKSYMRDDFKSLVLEIVKSIFFELSSKYSIYLYLVQITENYDEEDNSVTEVKEKLHGLKNLSLTCRYDKDLIEYYYRAMQMDESEFKYLAFYQVMECIYDEVFLEENINDIKQVINSSWFSCHKDEDIKQVIKIIEQYNKNKNDREKLKLVLEKYFKGNIHDEAYCLANKEILNILLEMHLMKNENEFKDVQRLATIIYDYRCKCTHSNRAFPFRTNYDNLSEEVQHNYINLIKKISERIIMNYRTCEIRKEI
jgi:Zn-finger protein